MDQELFGAPQQSCYSLLVPACLDSLMHRLAGLADKVQPAELCLWSPDEDEWLLPLKRLAYRVGSML
ncbi:hypothetical protein [Mumia zhuanghuii]|uniref:Uncharacterized protein n=1 Tax=Mumia zhuanghuii TaxID=2585211 RepID=A0A5C4MEY0_9ACTN|nr:hypothetical protein [Mumia zhuanghuii]TNC31288.1 hypothetical protein FHE65_31945 [Mumia zhuanghuii]